MPAPHRPYTEYVRHPADDMVARSADFLDMIHRRRTIRTFSDEVPPREVIDNAIRAAASAPSGANMQPWHFVVVTDAETKRRIREAAEEEERVFYSERASAEWLAALEPFGTDWRKPFLETAPYLIAVFQQNYGHGPNDERVKHYYVQESTGIAAGFLIAALTAAGVATLTHTPNPMGFLRDILGRPKNEKPIMILVAGYPAPGCEVPELPKKPFDEICSSI
jgi:iodotyrosine deiodinase